MKRRALGMVCALAVGFANAAVASAESVASSVAASAASCSGADLRDDFTPAEMQRLADAQAATPYATGRSWMARRGDEVILLVGTYHLPDARHAALREAMRDEIQAARMLLVEADAEDQASLQLFIATHPEVLIAPTDTGLKSRLSAAEWADLEAAVALRGMPGEVADRFTPLYLTILLAVPPCMREALENDPDAGIDNQLIALAGQIGTPVDGLEAAETALGLLDGLSLDQQAAVIRGALGGVDVADRYTITVADSYFDGQIWQLWELDQILAERGGMAPEEVAEISAALKDRLMDRRNADWIDKIVQAASPDAPVVVAVGALHLPGEAGVLRLLEGEGFAVTPYDPTTNWPAKR